MTFIHVSLPSAIPEISPKFVNGSRVYETPDGNLPSITTILGSLPRFKFGLSKWIEKVGKEFAEFEKKRCLDRGTQFHQMIELYLKNKSLSSPFGVLPKALFQNAIEKLNQINFIQAIEQPLWSKELGVAGTTDCIGNYQNTLSVIDFKTSTKPKQKSWIKSYFLQETAYSLMYEERTGIPIKQIVTIVSAEDGTVQEFIESREHFVDELKDCMIEAKSLTKGVIVK